MSVEYRREGDVAVITLNRPDRFNAIEGTISTGLVEALGHAGVEARAAVITGAGKAFCAGADLAELEPEYDDGGPDLAEHLENVFHPMIDEVMKCGVPTVAAINGVAAGAGLGLALACDLRIMAGSAFLTSAFTAIGLIPDSGTTWWLPQMVGVSRALELTLTNRRVPADEAMAMGLCLETVPDDQLLERAGELAGTLADMVPDSLVTTRRLIREAMVKPFGAALAAEQMEQGRLGKTREHAEGVRAFLEKRRPDFRSPG